MRPKSWPALVGAPLLALADQSVAYALVAWSCAEQDRVLLHLVHLVFLAGVLVTVALAWRGLRPAVSAADQGGSQAPGTFFPLIAVLVGALSALLIVAMWIPNWTVSPCFA